MEEYVHMIWISLLTAKVKSIYGKSRCITPERKSRKV
jgi:hypothetical protein